MGGGIQHMETKENKRKQKRAGCQGASWKWGAELEGVLYHKMHGPLGIV